MVGFPIGNLFFMVEKWYCMIMKNKKHYYLIGICGVAMSGLARLLQDKGNIVSGSDLKECQITGVKCYFGHSESNITKDIDEVIYTAAITKSAAGFVELEKARKLGIKTTTRSKFIGKYMNDKYGIAIAGMHGKTTVSTMISLILEEAGYNPTCFIGSDVKEWKSNVRVGHPIKSDNKIKEYVVAEACEYERQMLDFRPKAAIITNLEPEHLDTYKNGMPDIMQAFKKFVKLLPKNGLLVLCTDNKNVMRLKKYAKCKVRIYTVKKPWIGLKLLIPGTHNLQNATGAARLCHELGVKSNIIKKSLNNFTGAARRFEFKGEKDHITVIDDYGHHPTEIKATIAAAKEWIRKNNAKQLIVVFQPHQQERTRLLFADFVKSFDEADTVIIAPVYKIAGREKDLKEDLSNKLVQAISKNKQDIFYAKDYDSALQNLKKIVKPNDIILTLGATDIYKVGEKFLHEK